MTSIGFFFSKFNTGLAGGQKVGGGGALLFKGEIRFCFYQDHSDHIWFKSPPGSAGPVLVRLRCPKIDFFIFFVQLAGLAKFRTEPIFGSLEGI